MTALAKKEFRKTTGSQKPDKVASTGNYAGKLRTEIIKLKIKDKKDFIIESTKKKINVKRLIDKLDFEFFPWRLEGTDGKIYDISKIRKDDDFGGGGAGAKLAKNTAITESGQAYYCSLVFNVIKRTLKLEDLTDENFEEAAKYVEASTPLKKFLKEGPKDWQDSDSNAGNVYMNSANLLYGKYKGKFKGNVICHRGSKFMDNLYQAFKDAKKLDEKEDKLAPGSLNNDKWNPGDIWLTTFDSNEKPLEECRNLIDLKTCVLSFAGLLTDKDVKLLAVSLKKPDSKNVPFKEFNTAVRTNNLAKNVKYAGFSYGKTGDFFSSNDVYLYAGGSTNAPIQFRAFNTTSGWQGNIIGSGALGGKIGGGNVDYYLKKQKGLTGWDFGEPFKEKLTPSKADIKELYELYAKYIDKQKIKSPTKELSRAAFEKERKSKPPAFTFQKYMGLKLIDAVEQLPTKGKQGVILEMVRYAMSNTDVSTYFVKVGE